MKVKIVNYSFDAADKQITFTDFSTINLSDILLIVNATSNKIIYNFASLGGTVSGNVLTLNYDTTSMSNSDKLLIFYDNIETASSDEMLENILNTLNIIASLAGAKGSVGDIRTSVLNTVTVSGNIGTVTNLTNVGAVEATMLGNSILRMNSLAVLSNINNIG